MAIKPPIIRTIFDKWVEGLTYHEIKDYLIKNKIVDSIHEATIRNNLTNPRNKRFVREDVFNKAFIKNKIGNRSKVEIEYIKVLFDLRVNHNMRFSEIEEYLKEINYPYYTSAVNMSGIIKDIRSIYIVGSELFNKANEIKRIPPKTKIEKDDENEK